MSSDETTLAGIFILLNLVLVISAIILLYKVFVKKQTPEYTFIWSLALDNDNIVLGILNYATIVLDVLGVIGVIGYYIGDILF